MNIGDYVEVKTDVDGVDTEYNNVIVPKGTQGTVIDVKDDGSILVEVDFYDNEIYYPLWYISTYPDHVNLIES